MRHELPCGIHNPILNHSLSLPTSGYWDIRTLSQYLSVKSCTLYAWAAHGKIPCIKIHGLVRFRRDEIDRWLESFRERPKPATSQAVRARPVDIAAVIARAKRSAYNPAHGETRRGSSPIGKEAEDGAV
ncbi:helix-turn-helix domain-containing protein [Nitrospira sp. Nam80]